MKIYMAVTSDEYELPIYVGKDIHDLAKKFNTSENNIRSGITHKTTGKLRGFKFVKVEVEEDESEVG